MDMAFTVYPGALFDSHERLHLLRVAKYVDNRVVGHAE